ncbi:RING-H2 finger protein ATL11-like [Hevea brasiliensis]|uniref:RING-H2 finger protein ATL11-like n=1 Tax=Hevea brasiliensis TaxID=3981 RepID=UPI0025DEB0DE|nr:RING-H2 finger protein ATL11-like [Hevea brasiliensis]
MYDSENIIQRWWWSLWILDLGALTLLLLIIILQFCIWLWKLGGRVLDREIEIISDEDDHPATTKPQLTAEALEEEFPSFTRWQISDECAICFEKFKEEDECRMFLPSCIHIFHKVCIDLWLSKDNSCPLCRVELFSNPRRRVVDIELAIIWNEDDHSEPAAAAAPTKPQLTAEALEEAFPSFAHGKIVKSDECAICLEEFKEGEKCRMLFPSCVHIFHKDCIDIWLSEDTRCPLCRAVLFS